MNGTKVVDQAPKLESDSFDCLNDLCDVSTLEPEGLSSYLIPAVLGSFVKENTFKNLKNSSHQTSLLDSWIVEYQLIDRPEQQMMPSACPSHNVSGFMLQPPVSHAREEVVGGEG
ncbi:hypothetical protein L873DRAFT_1791267 [Choiromyces venosus 120613-1]|uniref:Uncharacterized protein n=1 Tax=Choiromyces venosus 120613-1 TaxID=1336337 RepID=A0A3N4JKN3_9PEZI|nr:hypothetical protein L873DRAFT_1791267 [Choiromyces venosus 120613-1]